MTDYSGAITESSWAADQPDGPRAASDHTWNSARGDSTAIVDVVLPCLDEAAALPGVLGAMPSHYRAVVVDNGSRDGSPEVARELGARVVLEPRQGYGAAVHSGLLACTSDFVCFIDADGSLDPGLLPMMVEEVRSGSADMAVGRRVPAQRGVWPWHARAGNAVLSGLLRRRGVPVHDIAPIRVVRRATLLELQITDRSFGYPLELLLKAGAAGWHIREHDVDYLPRALGTKSKVSGSLRGTVRAVRDMAKVLS